MVNNWPGALEARLFPGICILCRQPATQVLDLCEYCLVGLPANRHACLRCGIPLPPKPADETLGRSCGQCLTTASPITRTIAPWRYHFPLDAVIGQIKHRRRRDYLQVLAGAWLQAAGPALGDLSDELPNAIPDALVPVPLHWRRRFWRGFNQAEELALTIGNSLNIQILTNTRRLRHTPPQQRLHARERRKNLRGAFALKGSVEGLHLAIVDDVVTTGATTAQLAEILKAGGATQIDIWCLARTP